MKYIFDFDDVILENTKKLKPYIFGALFHQYGITEEESRAEYAKLSNEEFSTKKFIRGLFAKHGIPESEISDIYQRIISSCKAFLNTEMLLLIESLGRENCYLVTNGEREWQEDKLAVTEVRKYFKESNIVTGSKKNEISRICLENRTEKVLFIDDKQKHLDEVDSKELPNLVKFHFKPETSVRELRSEINRSQNPEIVEVKRLA
jgi:hypothetical protein